MSVVTVVQETAWSETVCENQNKSENSQLLNVPESQNRFNVAFYDTDQQNNVLSGVRVKTGVYKAFESEDTPESSPVQLVLEVAWRGEWRSREVSGYRNISCC